MPMTRQEIFDTAVKGLASQMFKRSSGPSGKCLYRGPRGLKCAIGHCLSDEELTSDRYDGLRFEGSMCYLPDKARQKLSYDENSDFFLSYNMPMTTRPDLNR